jgi:hypothetical protein
MLSQETEMKRRTAISAVLAAPATLAIAAAAQPERVNPKGIMDTFPGAVWTMTGGHVVQVGGTDDAEAIAAAVTALEDSVTVADHIYRVSHVGGAPSAPRQRGTALVGDTGYRVHRVNGTWWAMRLF